MLTPEQLDELYTKLQQYDIIILSCGAKKDSERGSGPAKEMYLGGFFKKQMAVAEKLGKPFYIMSSKYGVIAPDDIIEDYNMVWNNTIKRATSNPDVEVATEEHRIAVSKQAEEMFEGKKVLSFCSKFYKKHQPHFDFFNELIMPYTPGPHNRGLPFINKALHQILTEV